MELLNKTQKKNHIDSPLNNDVNEYVFELDLKSNQVQSKVLEWDEVEGGCDRS